MLYLRRSASFDWFPHAPTAGPIRVTRPPRFLLLVFWGPGLSGTPKPTARLILELVLRNNFGPLDPPASRFDLPPSTFLQWAPSKFWGAARVFLLQTVQYQIKQGAVKKKRLHFRPPLFGAPLGIFFRDPL